MTTRACLLLLAVALSAALAASTAHAGPSAAGRWTGTVDGQTIALELRAGGAATVAGEAGRWAEAGTTVEVADGDGNVYRGRLDGDGLVFEVGGARVRFTRVGGAAAASKPTAAPYRPGKTVTGKRVTPEGTELSFVLAKGWTGAWQQEAGQEAFVMRRPKGRADELVVGGARQLTTRERAEPVSALLRAWLPGLPERDRPVDVTIDGRPAAVVVSDGAATGKGRPRTTVIAQRVGDWVVSFSATYDVAREGAMRPVLDTLATTLRGTIAASPTAAPAAEAAPASLTGCWRASFSTGSGGGSTTKLQLGADGRYDWNATTNYGSLGGSVTREHGQWALLDGERLQLTPGDGSGARTFQVSFDGGRTLMLGDNRFRRCG